MIGRTISHYQILEKLGEGGMGVVYRAEDLDLKVTRALKFLPPHLASDAEQLARLRHEARAAAALEHPNICQVHEIGQADGQTFIVMSFLEGRTLADRLADEGSLPIGEALDIATQVGDALKRAHAAGIIHRDIKPANIMLTDGGQAVVMDFGLAKAADQTRLTKTGTTLGTATFMSPEQMRGEMVDARADLWALGVLLYVMVTGRVPFGGDNLPAVAYAVQHREPAAPSGIRPEVSTDLARVLDRTLAKDPQQRYQTADELLGDLEAVRDEQDLARKTALYDRRQKLKRRKRILFGAVAALVIAAVALAWWTRYQDLHRIDALAVLPFANLSGDQEQEFFSDGMTEALITELQQLALGKIRVIGRTSVMRYKETELSLPEIAAELGVDAVVEASVMRTGDLVKIAAKLIRARPEERQVWADTYEQNLNDVMSLHENVARHVVVQLGFRSEYSGQISGKVDPEAYNEFLLGKHIINSGAVNRALPHLERAIARDSTFAPAWAWAAHCIIMPTHGGWPSPKDDFEKARIYAERAIELDPELADGYFILAHILWEHDWDMPAAQEAFDRGFALNPNGGSGIGLLTYAMFHLIHGRMEEAVAATRKARELDPFEFLGNVAAFNVFSPAGLHEESVASLERAQEVFPEADLRHEWSWVHYGMGNYEEAIELKSELLAEAETDHGKFIQTLMLAHFHKCAGNPQEARRLYDRYWPLVDQDRVRPYHKAWMHADLGEIDESFAWLEIAYQQKDRYIPLSRLNRDVMFRDMADDPRYDRLLKKIGLED